jgi:hypothetical protein
LGNARIILKIHNVLFTGQKQGGNAHRTGIHKYAGIKHCRFLIKGIILRLLPRNPPARRGEESVRPVKQAAIGGCAIIFFLGIYGAAHTGVYRNE